MSNLLISASDVKEATKNFAEGEKARLFDNLLNYAIEGTEPNNGPEIDNFKNIMKFCDLVSTKPNGSKMEDVKRQIVNATKRRFS